MLLGCGIFCSFFAPLLAAEGWRDASPAASRPPHVRSSTSRRLSGYRYQYGEYREQLALFHGPDDVGPFFDPHLVL